MKKERRSRGRARAGAGARAAAAAGETRLKQQVQDLRGELDRAMQRGASLREELEAQQKATQDLQKKLNESEH
eukprot:11959126-Alexandrium_andersonii.AAC.1